MNLELHNVKEGNSQLNRESKQHLNMQKDKVGFNIYTFQYIFQGIVAPKNSTDRRKLAFNW